MSRTADRASATLSARLLRVMLVLAALGVMLVPLCADGMFAGQMSMSSAPAVVLSSGVPNEERVTAAASGPDLPAAPGDGLVVACIVFLVAVLAVALGSPRPPPAGYMVIDRSVRPAVPTCSARPLVLAQLCVLRT